MIEQFAARHPSKDVWIMTPRELVAWSQLMHINRCAEWRDFLALSTLAARGEPDDVKSQLAALET
jgi:hypothetical protein